MKEIKLSFLPQFVIALFAIAHPVALTAQTKLYPSKKLRPEKKLGQVVLFESRYQVVNNDTIHFYEKGEGEVISISSWNSNFFIFVEKRYQTNA